MADESIPAMKVPVQQKVLLRAMGTTGLDKEEEFAVDLGGARDGLPIVLVRLAWKAKIKPR
jgi:hypothetical protein